MSGGKYAFVDPGDADEQWRVLDADSGQDRSPASLSGGEQFIASLSLALGMVEMMARSGGRLESLFLDEGFGSLDRNNLDAAIQAELIAKLRERGQPAAIKTVGARRSWYHPKSEGESNGRVDPMADASADNRALRMAAVRHPQPASRRQRAWRLSSPVC